MPRLSMFFAKKQRLLVILAISFVGGLFLYFTFSSQMAVHSAAGPGWHDVISRQPPFKFRMPGHPRHEIRDVEIPALQVTEKKALIISDLGDRSFVLSIAAVPKFLGDISAKRLFDSEIDLLRESPDKFFLESFEPLQIGKEEAADFLLNNAEGGNPIRGRLLLHNGYIFTLFYKYPVNAFPEREYRTFIDSLSF